MEDKKKTPLEPEIEENNNHESQERSLQKVEKPKPLTTTFSRFSLLPFYNKWKEAGFRSFRRLVKEETGLMEDFVEHAKKKDRLLDIDIEIETDHFERLNRLQTARRKFKGSPREDEIAELSMEVRKMELQKEKTKLEGEIKGKEDKQKGLSPPERILQGARDKLKTMEARGVAVWEVQEDKERFMKTIDCDKNPRLCQQIGNMYDALIMSIMEGGQK
jgi:hypothetical protein